MHWCSAKREIFAWKQLPVFLPAFVSKPLELFCCPLYDHRIFCFLVLYEVAEKFPSFALLICGSSLLYCLLLKAQAAYPWSMEC
jgi:hypothetical protein